MHSPQTKKSVRTLISLPLISRAYSPSQRTSYERNPKSGSLLRIPPQIIISPARPTIREQRLGFSKVVFMKLGSHLLHLCGSMENVPSFVSASSNPTDSYLCSRLGQKRPVVCHFLLLLLASAQITAQLWYNRRRHGPTRSRISNCGLFLL